MVNKTLIFKFGVAIAAIGEICFLLGIMYIAFSEYDPTHVETFGIVITAILSAVASGVFLSLIYYVLKWKTNT